MKHTSRAKEFVAKSKDKKVKNILNVGGRAGAEKDFNEILRRASKPVSLQQQEHEPKSNQT